MESRSGLSADGRRLLPGLLLILALLGGCLPASARLPSPEPAAAASSPASSVNVPEKLTEAEERTLSSLERIDAYPLYTMDYFAPYRPVTLGVSSPPTHPWACSLFAALADPSRRLYGRNFDWTYSPAMLLFTDPPDGFASVSMVDIAYLVGTPTDIDSLHHRLPEDLRDLLDSPHLPFDGMNEHGLVVGMAAVSGGAAPQDSARPVVDDLEAIRWVLDRAQSVPEAIAILRSVNLSWGKGPPIHYLIADAGGDAALVELYGGELVVVPASGPWHQATNFFVAPFAQEGLEPLGQCRRYDRIHDELESAGGSLTVAGALDLLSAVSTPETQWSVVYDLTNKAVHVVMGRDYRTVYRFAIGD